MPPKSTTTPAAPKPAATPPPPVEMDLATMDWSKLPQDQLDAIMAAAAEQRAARTRAAEAAARREQLAKLSAHVVTIESSTEELKTAIEGGDLAAAAKAISAANIAIRELSQVAKAGNVKVTSASAARPGEDRDLVFDALGADPTRVWTVSDMTKHIVDVTGKIGKSGGAVHNNLDRAVALGYAELVSAPGETRRYQGTPAAAAAYAAKHAAPAAPAPATPAPAGPAGPVTRIEEDTIPE